MSCSVYNTPVETSFNVRQDEGLESCDTSALSADIFMEDHSLVPVPDDSLSLTDYALAIGQEFPDVETCRRALKDVAIAMHFDLRIVKSDRSRFIAKCSKEGCPWRVHVAKCPGVPTFTIRTLHGEHTCEGVRHLHHQQASVGWVARSVEARVRDNPRYKPKEILQDIRDQHGVAVSYMQAWRGKERSMAALHGTLEEGYRLLPAYCEQIRKTNPGSIASVFASGQENCFQRLFVSYRASIYGFIHACRPLLELDKAHLKGKYLGTLLCAASVDADDALFPLAIAIVDVESDENWMWFMSELRKLLGVNTDNMPRLTILSERQKGIVEAVETHFPSAFHGFCLRYVSENFRDTFKNTKLVNIFWNAVYALTAVEFESKIAEMMEISQDVIPWFQQFPPQLWAVAYFEGVRFGHFTLGVTELLYNWALECHELPIVQMMEHIRHQLASWFNDRRDMGMRLTSILVPSAEKRILEAIADARCYQVLRANEVEFEIVSTERTNIVDIRTRVCSCRRWHIYGLPCAHAAAALISCGHNVPLFAEPCFTVASYRETYSQMIHPIPDKSLWNEPGEGTEGGSAKVDIMIRPPKTRRPPGRPKKKVLRVENFKRPKRVVQCGDQLLPQPSKSSPPAVEDPAGSHRPPVAGSVGLLGPRKKGTKATTSVRAWLLIDSEGNSQVLEAGKHAIMRRTGLPARDLRILDPVLRCPSTVLGRERAIVINLEHIKAIITAQEVLLVNSADLSVTPFVDELRRRLVRHQQATTIASEGNDDGHTKLHDLGESRQNSPSGQHDGVGKEVVKKQLYGSKVLSFEFVALETCLEAACTSLENEAKGLEKEAHPALEKLSSKISTLNLERVRQIKSRLVAISGRVQKVRDEIEHLLDDDEDMAEMYLTDKLSVESDLENSSASSMNEQMRDEMDDEIHQAAEVDDRNSDTGTGTSKQLDVEELEMLLEAYFVQIDGTLNKLSTLREDVDDTEDYINIMLDDKQNQLLQMGVVLSTATLVVNAFIVVAGIFGMNIGIELFDEELKTGNKKFMWTIGGSSMACVFFFVIAIAWGKHMHLLDIPSLFFVCSRRIRKNVRWFA